MRVQHKDYAIVFIFLLLNADSSLDEVVFAQLLINLGAVLSDDQVLALFAYFDRDYSGVVQFYYFVNYAMSNF